MVVGVVAEEVVRTAPSSITAPLPTEILPPTAVADPPPGVIVTNLPILVNWPKTTGEPLIGTDRRMPTDLAANRVAEVVKADLADHPGREGIVLELLQRLWPLIAGKVGPCRAVWPREGGGLAQPFDGREIAVEDGRRGGSRAWTLCRAVALVKGRVTGCQPRGLGPGATWPRHSAGCTERRPCRATEWWPRPES